MRIFYVTNGEHIAGGQLINLEHVRSLRAMGYDARFLITRAEPPPVFPPGLEAPWQSDLSDVRADDYLVIGEMHARAAVLLADSPARKVIHNQNWHYSFQAFLDFEAVRRWGCVAIIAGSRIGAERLQQMGWDRPIPAVRVFVDPIFDQDPLTPRPLRVCLMPRKRPLEPRLLRGTLRSLRPEVADVPWTAIADVTRPQAAEIVRTSAVFVSLSALEGLGLPPLEAMAAGTLVVGYHGEGGLEYATPENGDWFADGQQIALVHALADRLAALKAGETFEARRLAAAATAAGFSRAQFEAELKAVWDEILALR